VSLYVAYFWSTDTANGHGFRVFGGVKAPKNSAEVLALHDMVDKSLEHPSKRSIIINWIQMYE
jgi:hypothetical protein